MAERDVRRMTVEEFLAWRPGDDDRYELVEPDMVAGAFPVRSEDGHWSDHPVIGYDTRLDLTALGCSIELAELYPPRS